ncbi:Transcriptional activator protein AnoR [Aliiroseovarius sp. xm-m-379]|uniref:autoinducer binding domain-containing protein n=1 Tax=unclassified Aliiroseovarius TaxID=2623558 RepID=UPI0015682479|nr:MULTISPECIES: autoinducer binding domain-containing protein [unclassified Aliiroseovarius]NRP12621.1 Transcriptional activator protein AnoR [Aliiroseovarius sp. xm-d-517]NRP24546.1 Transcriptional activator protein AnoR [Aliiroseovarius sp. xm-m-379]NRP29644.1 Transcriptional activator protein AnoR [Aliiroseovarius sp. xm-m-314]NRP33345.1 Transcriptional activator protein AnoR [Aliiroseovarius sp. xm-a-104]NRP39654.1 Transcriptional activator protein AnoR [Aliiroseovarius sp. xm-m-339-2]
MGRNQSIDSLLSELTPLAEAGYFIGLHIRFVSPLMTFQTFPQAWTDHYTQNAYALRDPLIATGISHTGAIRWSAITLPDPFGIMDEAKTFGLAYGVCVSCGPVTSRTVASVARSDREFTDEEIATITGIVLRLHHETQPPDSLTNAEIEALRILAAGERYANGAALLGISESALKARLSSARKKLFARTSAEAIQRAKDYRLI